MFTYARPATRVPLGSVARSAVDPRRPIVQSATPRRNGGPAFGGWRIPDSGSPLPAPLRENFERSLGADLSAVRVHTQAASATAATAIGAHAFAVGSDIHFNAGKYAPDSREGRRLLAHEVAHTVQHERAGTDGASMEVSAPDDAHEIEAGRAADAMVHGATAAVSGAPTGLHRYVNVNEPEQRPDNFDAHVNLRVADDGRMAIGQQGIGAYGGSREAWMELSVVASSNASLKSAKSVIRLRTESDTMKGEASDGSGVRTLSRISPENTATATSGNTMRIWADCGRSGRDVMGAGEGTGKNYDKMAAMYGRDRKPPWWERLWHAIVGGSARTSETANTGASSPESMKKEIFQKVTGAASPDEGFASYLALSPGDRDAFDRKAKINRYAEPGVAEGYTMSSGGSDVPGHEADTWNFHWAGVVANSGRDRVTLENYAVGDPEAKNSDWSFQMYGPASKPGQTFHEQHQATGQHGQEPTTLAVHKR